MMERMLPMPVGRVVLAALAPVVSLGFVAAVAVMTAPVAVPRAGKADGQCLNPLRRSQIPAIRTAGILGALSVLPLRNLNTQKGTAGGPGAWSMSLSQIEGVAGKNPLRMRQGPVGVVSVCLDLSGCPDWIHSLNRDTRVWHIGHISAGAIGGRLGGTSAVKSARLTRSCSAAEVDTFFLSVRHRLHLR
jgi:hypothetical protein